jgi:glutathione S-transferase
MIRLYDRDTAGNPYKVRLLLGFLGLEYESIAIDRKDGRNLVDEQYLRLNPRGQIPTLDDDGFILWGSTAILIYLASRYDSERRWWPADARLAAQSAQWLELAQNEVQSGLFLARAISMFGYSGDLAAARAAGVKALNTLEMGLQDQDWLGGARATIADIACFAFTSLAGESGFDMIPFPKTVAWIGRFKGLDGYRDIARPARQA